MTDQPLGFWRRVIRWPYTKRGTIVLGCVVLLLCAVGVYEFVSAGGAIFIVCSAILFALVLREWVRLYRHRADPDWPPRPRWVSRIEQVSGATVPRDD
jgi:hypothetical protein